MNKIELEVYGMEECHSLYDYIVNGQCKGQFEVQFDEGGFNGKILYAGFNTENENGEFEWKSLEDKNLYDMVKEKAIKDNKQVK